MNYVEEQIVDSIRTLPLEKQQEVLAFIKALKQKMTAKGTES